MFPFRSKKTAQRKYIDLIQEAVTRWPNWTPSNIIQAGDFGKVDEETGELEVEGNIYTHDNTMQIANQYPPVPGAEVDKYSVHSLEVKGLDVEVATELEIPIGSAILGGGWKFSSKRGAILLMHKARPTRVPDAFFTAASLHISALKNMYVVYEVWNCPGYYMYLSNGSSETVTVGLQMNAAGANITAALNWVSKGSIGVEQESYQDVSVYVPLFGMKKIRKPDKRRDENNLTEERWYEADAPWGDLDEDGVTEPDPIYDNVPDDD